MPQAGAGAADDFVMAMSWVRRVTATSLTVAMSAVLLVSTPQVARAEAPQVSGTETDLGVQIPGAVGAVRSEQSAQGALPDGRYLTYFTNSGGPGTAARFFAMDLAGAMVAEVPIPSGTDVLSIVYSPATRSVFFAANSPSASYLYEWDGGRLELVGTIPDQQVMRLAPSPEGPLYIGTFAPSNGRLHVYSGGTIVDLGQPVAGESYVRSLVVDSADVWVSNYRGTAARLVRVDRVTNARTAITTPAAFSGEWSAMDMSRAGSYLFLRTVNSSYLFAYNTATGTFDTFDDQVGRVTGGTESPNTVPHITGISPYGISPLLEDRYVYFQRSGAGIMRIDVANGLKTVRVDKYNKTDNPVSWPSASVPGPVSYAWLADVGGRSGYSLVTTTIDGKVLVNTPGQTGPLTFTLLAEDAPSTIIRLGTDSAGAVYTGGFDLPAGIGRHTPIQGSTALLPGPQIEGFGRYDSSVVMGGYTGNASSSAPIYQYSGTGGPVLRTHLNNSQERPVAIQQVSTKVAIGSVPIKNTLGGALSIWDPASNALTVERNIIPDHSVISLATHNGLVIGGSSNAGGTGSTPTVSDGQLFTYNPATEALKTFTPPRAASATYSWVAAITPDPVQPGRFWAISTGYVIQFQVAADGSITLTKNLGAFPNTSSPTGKELGIEFVGGTMFATVDQGVSAINTTTGERTVVAAKTDTGPVVGLVRLGSTNLYYARGARLYRYAVDSATSTTTLQAPRVTSPDLSQVQEPGTFVFLGTGTKNSTVTLSDGLRTRSTLVTDGGSWTMGAIDFAAGTHTLTFTASLAGFSSQVTTVVLTAATSTCDLEPPVPTNVVVGGYNSPSQEYAFAGAGSPGSLITMVSGTRTRTATVREDGTWAMNPVWFGWWAGTVPFTASKSGCTSVVNDVPTTFATDPGYHVPTLLTSHTSTTYHAGGEIKLRGKGTPGALITLEAGGQTRYAAVSSTGRWHLRAITVGPAPASFTFTSTVPGYPAKSATNEVYFGDAPTGLVKPLLTSHAEGSAAAAGSVIFAGKGIPNSKVSLSFDGQERSGFARSNGRWDLSPIDIPPGTQRLTFVASAPGLTSASESVTVPFS